MPAIVVVREVDVHGRGAETAAFFVVAAFVGSTISDELTDEALLDGRGLPVDRVQVPLRTIAVPVRGWLPGLLVAATRRDAPVPLMAAVKRRDTAARNAASRVLGVRLL